MIFFSFLDVFKVCHWNLDKVLVRCKETNLVLNREKCNFLVREGILLGHKVSKSSLEVGKAKVEVIEKLPSPISVKGCVVFLSMYVFTNDSSWIFQRLQDKCAIFWRRRCSLTLMHRF